MNSVDVLKIIPIFVLFRDTARHLYEIDSLSPNQDFMDINFLAMANYRISSISLFSDEIWDFNDDDKAAVRNVQGAKLRIDWSVAPEIPPNIIIELKLILILLIHAGPSISRKRKKVKKVNTVLPKIRKGLAFFNVLFESLNGTFGKCFVIHKFVSLKMLSLNHFEDAAERFHQAYNSELATFFSNLYNSFIEDRVFGEPIVRFDYRAAKWPICGKAESRNSVITVAQAVREVTSESKKNIIPDHLFERFVFNASIVVVDFLKALDVDFQDKEVEKFQSLFTGDLAKDVGLNPELWAMYRSHRLLNKGHDERYVASLNEGFNFELKGTRNQVNAALKAGVSTNDFRLYVNKVSYACCFLVAQFTAMRPSELQEIIVKDKKCLIRQESQWLLISEVKKGKKADDLSGLFDDKWVAIPIVQDAISAAAIISEMRANPYLFSNADTVRAGKKAQSMASQGIKHQLDKLVECIFPGASDLLGGFNAYMARHTLAYQLYKMDLGLPLISFQLKHFVTDVEKFIGRNSGVTLSYGEIGDRLATTGRGGVDKSLRRTAEIDAIKGIMDPDGVYIGKKGAEHQARLKVIFAGYMASGYTKEQIFEKMAEQGIALINVGQGFCYGNRFEEFDTSIPCIGTLRCNPVRCSNAVVTKLNVPKWREVYYSNKAALERPELSENWLQMRAAMEEAAMVLEYLGADF